MNVEGRVGYSVIRERCGSRRSLLKQRDQTLLKWFGHIGRKGDGMLVKSIYVAEVEGRCLPKRE